MELIIIMVLALVLGPVVELTAGPFRIILGAIFLLIFPGYTLLAAIFARKDSLQGVERVALSLILSVAIVPLVGLILNYTPWGIRPEPIFITIASFTCIASLLALFRRSRLPRSERFEPRINLKLPHWGSTTRLDKALSFVLLLAIMGAIGALVYVVTAPRAEENFTDFYILGSGDMMQDYPQELVLGEQAEVTLGIVNHEHEHANYNIRVRWDGETAQEIGPIGLADEEEWRERVVLIPPKAGDDQKVEFLLYKGEGDEPYLALHLWVDVKQEV